MTTIITTITTDDLRELHESEFMEPVLVLWLDNLSVTVESAVQLRDTSYTWHGRPRYIITDQEGLRIMLAAVEDGPDEDDYRAVAQFLQERLTER